jgi:hypothetical protein
MAAQLLQLLFHCRPCLAFLQVIRERGQAQHSISSRLLSSASPQHVAQTKELLLSEVRPK